MAQKRSGSVDRTGATLLAIVLLLLGVVALASRSALGGSIANVALGALGQTPRITRSPLGVMLVCGGAVLALFGLYIYQRLQMRLGRKEDPLQTKPYRKRWNTHIALLFLPIAVGVLIILAGVFGSHPHPRLILPHGFGAATRPGETRHAGPASSFDVPGWVPFALLGVLIMPAALMLLRPPKRWSATYSPRRSAAPAFKAAVEQSLLELRTDPDPRRAVVASYRRMEEALAAVGLPRGPAEAPREYLTRALGALELSAGPPSTLTTLFERAKFSLLAVDLPLRDQAIGALLVMQRELEGLT